MWIDKTIVHASIDKTSFNLIYDKWCVLLIEMKVFSWLTLKWKKFKQKKSCWSFKLTVITKRNKVTRNKC